MPRFERPKLYTKEQIFERGLKEDDAAQVVGGVIEMLRRYTEEPFSSILQSVATKIETDYSYREYHDMGGAPKPDDLVESGRESVKMVARALRKIDGKFALLEKAAPPEEKMEVRQQLVKELEMLKNAIHEKRTEWVKGLSSNSQS